MIEIPELVRDTVTSHPYPLLFATISGAHLYGFPSSDSDYDLRGVHVLPLAQVAGLDRMHDDTLTRILPGPPEVDLVTHDVEKFFRLLLKPNGYVLEQIYSPLVVHTTPEHAELKEIARGCITRHHVRHYVGFAENQWKLFDAEDPPRIKPLLYVFRVLLTGIHLLHTGEVEANLVRLNEQARLSFVSELIQRKAAAEHGQLSREDVDRYRPEYERLLAALEGAGETSRLPEQSSARPALNDLLLRVRGVTPSRTTPRST